MTSVPAAAGAPSSSPPPAGGRAPRVVMIQGGARRRYAVPLALQRAGILERMFSSGFIPRGSPRAGLLRLLGKVRPTLAKKASSHRCDELDPAKVVVSPWLAARMYLRAKPTPEFFMWEAEQTAKWILGKGFGRANALYGFISNMAPTLLAGARRRGLVTVGDQIIAPLAEELAELREQMRRWPGWEPGAQVESRGQMADFERRTWEELDHITCMSEYVRDGLLAQGVPPGKVSLIQYPFDAGAFPTFDRSGRARPLTVGFVGQIGLRKGAPYFFEVARRFDPRQVRFVMVGQLVLDPAKAEAQRGAVELVGPVPRAQVTEWLSKFDVFFFPSTCEGSAGAVMEAMASGLPVVTTHNSGTVARDGVEGFIARYDDVDRFHECIARLADDEALRLTMGAAARRRVETFNLEWYSRELRDLFGRLVSPTPQATAG